MAYLSGAPLYYFTLAQELAKYYKVYLRTEWTNPYHKDENAKYLYQGLIKSGVTMVIDPSEYEYDLGIFSHGIHGIECCKKVAYIIHSEFNVETPIIDRRIDYYICIRPSIKDHVVNEHGIDEKKCFVLYNGIDRNKFSKFKRRKINDGTTRWVVPCTLDKLREKFLNHVISLSNDKMQVQIYGLQAGASLIDGKNVIINPPTFEIEKAMSNADYVAGIMLGRVNLEANSMGIPSIIYDPYTLERTEFLLDERTFDKRHNIENVANELIKLSRK
jgi:glycosyltransferase involved in cell wall biosynthesis